MNSLPNFDQLVKDNEGFNEALRIFGLAQNLGGLNYLPEAQKRQWIALSEENRATAIKAFVEIIELSANAYYDEGQAEERGEIDGQ